MVLLLLLLITTQKWDGPDDNMKFVYYICDACQAKALDMMAFNLGGQSDRHYCLSCAVKISQSVINMVESLQAERAGKTNCNQLQIPTEEEA